MRAAIFSQQNNTTIYIQKKKRSKRDRKLKIS